MAGARSLLQPGRYAGTLHREIAALFPGAAIRSYDTGRAALAEAIRVAMRMTGRPRVVLPALTSFSVASAASVAGAGVDLCDIDRHSLLLDRDDLRRCVTEQTAAVVLGNPYGLADRTTDLAWLRDAGVLLIDDAAQSLGASENGFAVGMRGDLGVLSFGRGKCVSLGMGGALLAHDEAVFQAGGLGHVGPGRRGLKEWIGCVVTAACVYPAVFGALSRLPGLRIGESWYEPAFAIHGLSAAADGLAADLADAVARQRTVRSRVVTRWREALRSVSGLSFPEPARGIVPAWLRLPVLVMSGAAREALVASIAAARFSYVRSFPLPLNGLEAFVRERCSPRATPGAVEVCNRLVVLPAHSAVSPADIRAAVAAIGG